MAYTCKPVFYSPISHTMDHMFTWQATSCANAELDYFRCAARVGEMKTEYECATELHDFMECTSRKMSKERFKIMQAERKKQGKPYLPPPPGYVYGGIM